MRNLSILIPTHNRPDYLKMSLGYYASFVGDYNITIADSSDAENKKRNRKTVSSFPDIHCTYIDHFSPDTNFSHKIADAVDTIPDEYCVLCADDDFLTSAGLAYAMDFLNNYPHYTIAHGRYISFALEEKTRSRPGFVWSATYSPRSIESEDPQTRLAAHLSSYSTPTLYAVHRTAVLSTVFKETIRNSEDDRFGELLPSMLSIIHGKMKAFEILYCARQRLPCSASSSSKNLADFINDGTYDKKYHAFRRCLAEHLTERSSLNLENAMRKIDEAMTIYLSRFYTGNNSKPGPVKKRIANMYHYIQDPMNIPLSKNYSEFKKIRDYVLQQQAQ